MTDADRMPVPTRPWWHGATIYQIYPRSFADSNGDGIGDLAGITGRLDYVASLGVDAIWLSPFFTSPMKDFGYDVANYCNVDPIFGTLADFDALVARAHILGLRIVIDQVWSHTSEEHPWFIESRSSRTNPKADWYVWADAKPDGSPPSNWQSVFGGPAWTWDARRRQYYLHNFLKEQPQLHGHNRDVQNALLDTARFWLDRGVDGFRLDAINFAMHDPGLRDNPPAPSNGNPRTRPFDFQRKLYNQSHPDIPAFLQRVRLVLDGYEADRFTVAEIGGDDATREMKLFCGGTDKLNTAYGFDFLYAPELSPRILRDALECWGEDSPWPSWAFENHDAPRAMSRWLPQGADAVAFGRIKMLLLACLRGNIFVYNGEELGLPQVDIAFEDLRDPEAIANWPLTLSRDGARTPMPWAADAENLGFGIGKPWLPLGEAHRALAVDRQADDAASLLNFTRHVIALRNAHPALRHGSMTILEASDALLIFDREADGERLRCVFNLSDTAQDVAGQGGWHAIETIGDVNGTRYGPFAAMVAVPS